MARRHCSVPGRIVSQPGTVSAMSSSADSGPVSEPLMNLDAIKQILELVREHELAEFELEQDGVKIRVRKQGGTPVVQVPQVMVSAPTPAAPPAVNATPAPTPVSAAPTETEEPVETLELAVVTSPIVGTFYRASDPSSPPFVEIGQDVRKGQVLCIIEAMKLMNEIESEYEGEIVRVYVENGQPVQYGERLFAIRTLS
jgi:acetyl-CoA carboxylase biotin carboxyl carrier protein